MNISQQEIDYDNIVLRDEIFKFIFNSNIIFVIK